MRIGAFAVPGDPDRIAALAEDTVPRCAVADGESVQPADVCALTAGEQDAGRAPRRESYDTAKLQEGVPSGWLVKYLGSTLKR